MQRRIFLAGGAVAVAGCATGVGATRAPTRVAFGSCADQTQPQPIWDAVLADRPEVVIYGGDNVYASREFTVAKLEAAYARQAAEPSFARLRAAVPSLAIWDDNDYGANDGGAEFPHKAESKTAFLRFWNADASDPRRGREGIFHSHLIGPPGRRVQVLLLDTRWFRSPWRPTDQRDAPGKQRYLPDFSSGKTMLGDLQWQWLGERLREPAEVRLLVSGVQVIADGHGWERWGNFPLELTRLMRLILVSRADGLVLLSGDRHVGAFYRENRGPVPYPLYEMTSSGITHPWREAREASPNRIGELFTERHYGMVEVDWAARRIDLQLKDQAGAVRRSQAIPFDELKIRS
jgi:alkaline phosphatase D